MLVNVVSESVWAPKIWGGIHTAFLNNIQALKRKEINFVTNSLSSADITHIHSFGIFGLYKLLTSKKTIVTTHMTPETQAGTFKMGRFGVPITKWYLKFFYNKADLVIALTEKVKQDLENLGVKTKMVIIPNPINSDVFKIDLNLRKQTRKMQGFDDNVFIALSVGHVVIRKGIEDFISLAKELPEYKFIWVGAKVADLVGAETEGQKEMIENAPKNFHLTGYVPYDKIVSYYNMADVLFFPSYKEIASMVIIEAAACGLPLVLRDLPEYKELYNNHFVPCKNNDEFKKALMKLSTNKQYLNEMHKKSEELTKNFSLERMGEELLKQYRLLNTF